MQGVCWGTLACGWAVNPPSPSAAVGHVVASMTHDMLMEGEQRVGPQGSSPPDP